MIAYLILAPSVLLIVASLIIVFLQIRRPRFGFSWLIATTASLLVWAMLIYLRLRLPETLTIAKWQPSSLFSGQPVLVIDRFSWPYAAGLAALVLAVILTEAARTQYHAHPLYWAGSLILGAAGLLAVLAGNPYTLMVAWTLVDLVELAVLLGGGEAAQLNQRIVIAFTARLLGTLSLVWAVVSAPLTGDTYNFSNLTSQAGFFLLLASGLRLGVLPLHLPFSQEPRLRRGMGTVLRLAPAASSLVLLGRLPQNIIPAGSVTWLTVLATAAALYSAAKWLAAENELAGRPYWVVGLAALSVECVITGKPIASLAWGMTLLLSGGLLFMYSARKPGLIYLPLLGLWGMSGLPFSLTAGGWQGFLTPGFTFWSFLLLLAQVLLMLGYIRHALMPGSILDAIERWARIVYPSGLLLLGLMAIIIAIWGWPGSRTVGVWWMGIVSTALVSIAATLYWRRRVFAGRLSLPAVMRGFQIIQSVVYFSGETLRLDWLYRLFWFIYGLLSRLVSNVTLILEGDGGVLWALVLLALLASLIGKG